MANNSADYPSGSVELPETPPTTTVDEACSPSKIEPYPDPGDFWANDGLAIDPTNSGIGDLDDFNYGESSNDRFDFEASSFFGYEDPGNSDIGLDRFNEDLSNVDSQGLDEFNEDPGIFKFDLSNVDSQGLDESNCGYEDLGRSNIDRHGDFSIIKIDSDPGQIFPHGYTKSENTALPNDWSLQSPPDGSFQSPPSRTSPFPQGGPPPSTQNRSYLPTQHMFPPLPQGGSYASCRTTSANLQVMSPSLPQDGSIPLSQDLSHSVHLKVHPMPTKLQRDQNNKNSKNSMGPNPNILQGLRRPQNKGVQSRQPIGQRGSPMIQPPHPMVQSSHSMIQPPHLMVQQPRLMVQPPYPMVQPPYPMVQPPWYPSQSTSYSGTSPSYPIQPSYDTNAPLMHPSQLTHYRKRTPHHLSQPLHHQGKPPHQYKNTPNSFQSHTQAPYNHIRPPRFPRLTEPEHAVQPPLQAKPLLGMDTPGIAIPDALFVDEELIDLHQDTLQHPDLFYQMPDNDHHPEPRFRPRPPQSQTYNHHKGNFNEQRGREEDPINLHQETQQHPSPHLQRSNRKRNRHERLEPYSQNEANSRLNNRYPSKERENVDGFDVDEQHPGNAKTPITWELHHPAFSYNQHGELSNLVYPTENIADYLQSHPLHQNEDGTSRGRDSRLILWIQTAPSNSKTRYPNKNSSKCRFADCPDKKNSIRKGFFRVALDEESASGFNVDPYRCAGFVHLYCLEKFCNFQVICQNLKVLPDNRRFEGEKNKMAVTRDHEEMLQVVRNFTANPPSNVPFVYEQSLCYQLTLKHKELEPNIRNATRATRGGNHIGLHMGDVDRYVEGEDKKWKARRLRPKTRKPSKRKRGNDEEEEESDLEDADLESEVRYRLRHVKRAKK